MERLQGSHSVLGWNDSRGVILSWDRTTPWESFSPGMKRLQRRHSVFRWNNSRKVLLSWDGTTLGESIYPRTEGPQGSHSVLGLNDSRGIILSWDGTTSGIVCMWNSNSVLYLHLSEGACRVYTWCARSSSCRVCMRIICYIYVHC